MPPWAKKESDSSARLFVIIQTFYVSGKFNAQNKPAAPVPTIITSYTVFIISPLQVSIILFFIT